MIGDYESYFDKLDLRTNYRFQSFEDFDQMITKVKVIADASEEDREMILLGIKQRFE